MNDYEEINRLNQLGEKWYNMPEEGNEAIRLSLCEEIFSLAYKLFPWQSNTMGLFFEKDWPKFDPNQGKLYDFFQNRLEWRKIDVDRQDFDGKWVENTNEATGEKYRVKKGHTPLNPTSEEDGARLMDTLRSENDVDDRGLRLNDTVLALTTLMLNLRTRLGSKAGNPDKFGMIDYYHLFFTDEIADIIQFCDSIEIKAFTRRERDLFEVLKKSFLNFCMRSPCGSVEDIWHNDWKLYGQIVEGRPMEPPKKVVEKKGKNGKKRREQKRFLPLDVYTTYLERVVNKRVGVSTVSQQRRAYEEYMEKFMKGQLQC